MNKDKETSERGAEEEREQERGTNLKADPFLRNHLHNKQQVKTCWLLF